MHPLLRTCAFFRDFYALDASSSDADFLCDADTARSLAGDEAILRREVLLVVEHSGDTQVALYLDPKAISVMRESGSVFAFDHAVESCLVVEGASHLLYLLSRDNHGESVSQLELELQAEVDKYTAALLCGDGAEVGLEGNGAGMFFARQRSAAIRAFLFRDLRYIDDPDSECGTRYRDANDYAARYALAIERRYVGGGRERELRNELCGFHRMNQRQKLERIRAL